MARYIEENIGDLEIEARANETYLKQAALSGYVGTFNAARPTPSYSRACRKQKSIGCWQSFAFKNCKQRPELIAVLSKHMARSSHG